MSISKIQHFSDTFLKQALLVCLAGFPSRKDVVAKFKSNPQKLELIEDIAPIMAHL